MKKLDIYRQILADSISTKMCDVDVLLHMVVLHTHSIVVDPCVIVEDVRSSSEHGVVLAPLTRRHLAEFVSSLWESSEERGTAEHWYTLYDQVTPYEVFEDVSAELHDRALAVKMKIANHSLVAQMLEE